MELDQPAYNPWPRQERVQRKALKRVMRNQGVRPARRQWMVCVQTTALAIPAWALARRDKRMPVSEHHVWFNGRTNGRAKILERQDRMAGGSPELTAVEWRACPVCGRLLLNLEAEARRRLDERSALGRQEPCGAECGK